MQETEHRIKDVAAGEEAAEDLRVVAVQPVAAELDRVLASDDGIVVSELAAPESLVDRGLEEERIAEAEGGSKAGRRISGQVRGSRHARTPFAVVAEVGFIQLPRCYRGEQVYVVSLDLRRPLSAVR